MSEVSIRCVGCGKKQGEGKIEGEGESDGRGQERRARARATGTGKSDRATGGTTGKQATGR